MVSIVLTTYNHESTIAKCIDSMLMQQTSFPFTIIIGEDQSKDGTRAICKEYAQKYPNKITLYLRNRKDVIYIFGKPTGRYNFIENLKACKTKYIALCEGDDYWTDPFKLQKQVDFLEANPEYVVAYHDAKIINTNNEIVSASKLPDAFKRDFSAEDLMKAPFVLTLSMCFRNCLTNFPKEFYKIVNGDSFLVSMLGQYGKGKYLSNIEPAAYLIHGTSVWSSLDQLGQMKRKLHFYYTLVFYYKKLKKPTIYNFFIKKFDSHYSKYIELAIANASKKDITYAKILFTKSIFFNMKKKRIKKVIKLWLL